MLIKIMVSNGEPVCDIFKAAIKL